MNDSYSLYHAVENNEMWLHNRLSRTISGLEVGQFPVGTLRPNGLADGLRDET
jgi:hypothetical protein